MGLYHEPANLVSVVKTVYRIIAGRPCIGGTDNKVVVNNTRRHAPILLLTNTNVISVRARHIASKNSPRTPRVLPTLLVQYSSPLNYFTKGELGRKHY